MALRKACDLVNVEANSLTTSHNASFSTMFVFSETNSFWQAVNITPRVLTRPDQVLAEQKAQQKGKAMKQANKSLKDLKDISWRVY